MRPMVQDMSEEDNMKVLRALSINYKGSEDFNDLVMRKQISFEAKLF